MSQQNGPTVEYKEPAKEEIKDMQKQQIGNGSQPPLAPGSQPQRPLSRTDSRTSFPYRPPFPNQQPPGVPPRPQLPRPPLQQQFPQRVPAPPPPGQQRPPGLLPGVPPGQPFPGHLQRAGFRPSSPFPRPPVPNQRPPGVFQQRSVPAFGNTRPPIPEEGIVRSQTLDSSELEPSRIDDGKSAPQDFVKAPSIAAMNNRSYSLSSNAPEIHVDSREEARRKSVSSVDNYGEGKPPSRPSSRQDSWGSSDNLDKKEEVPSRPESRSASRMNKIVEDEDKSSSLTDVSQKSADTSANLSKNHAPDSTLTADLTDKPPSGSQQDKTTKEKPNKNDKHLDLNKSPRVKSSKKSEGDNDSGVDESTQGNESSTNGDVRSPRKNSKSRTSSSTPVARSLSRGSKSPSLKSPDSNATTPGSISEKKKIPMNKVQVGHAPSPNLKVVKSKIGSLDNANYKPGGGNVKIETKKVEIKAAPRIEAKNDKYVPKGGEKKIVHQKLQWNAKPKIGSLENATHKPKGGDKKIESIKLDFKEKAKPKVGSKDNIKHQPGGGDVKSDEKKEDKDFAIGKSDNFKESDKTDQKDKIETKKIDLKVSSKIGSLDNVKYKPGGGEKKIFDDKDYLRQMSAVSSIEHSLSTSQNSIPSQPDKTPVADENLNRER
ncbi:unnamed protein product [Phyllotreta striolata]|uniref:Microtubule-associated protein n=1 Tax=Phyllotreta striolata TaxID=444603 RepID=A0A9N9XR66_PHYSR|nr:unnamed protein product [Phyllotreta striolata]